MKISKKYLLYICAPIIILSILIYSANYAYKSHVLYYSCQSNFLNIIKPGVSLDKTIYYLDKAGIKYKIMKSSEYKKAEYRYVAPKLTEDTNTRLIIDHYTDRFILVPDGCQYIMDFNDKGILLKKYKQ